MEPLAVLSRRFHLQMRYPLPGSYCPPPALFGMMFPIVDEEFGRAGLNLEIGLDINLLLTKPV